ncbi:MAG: hypothetical protein ACRC0J_02065, partial [Shewanella oncorhynchi]
SDKGLVVSLPVGELELLLCHGMSLFCQKESALILRVSKSSIYSTKPIDGVMQAFEGVSGQRHGQVTSKNSMLPDNSLMRQSRSSCPNSIPVISKLESVLDICLSLSLILRYIYCLVFIGAAPLAPKGCYVLSISPASK